VSDYDQWIASRSDTVEFESCPRAGTVADHLFSHQQDLVEWALRRGRAAIFADTGLGKTAMQIEWARHVSTAGRVLILAPLAVAEQTVREGARFGVPIRYLREDDGGSGIVITNYEMMDRFDVASLAGIVLDESSILKSYTGSTRTAIIEAYRDVPWRLACTATPAPNDFTELGNHSEFLGVKTRVEMLAEYFVHDGGSTQDWRIKGHAVTAFWRWVASWGAVVRRPSDLGYEDAGFRLPSLHMEEHVIRMGHDDAHAAGMLFAAQAVSLADQRAVRRGTMERRAQLAAELVGREDGPCIVWCELNDEADLVEDMVPGAVQVRGADDPDVKRDRLLGFADGKYRVMVTKPSIAGFGMNWQHCHRMIFVGASHSYEQTYQAIRRCWRFGQQRPVTVHVIRADVEQAIVQNYRRKEADAARLGDEMAAQVRDVIMAAVRGGHREWNPYTPTIPMQIPAWLQETP
jgi:hypothetical protein